MAGLVVVIAASAMAACQQTNLPETGGNTVYKRACYERDSPETLAPARFVDVPIEQQAKGVRYLDVSIAAGKGVTLGSAAVRESATGASLDISDQGAVTGGYHFVVRVPDRVTDFSGTVGASCENNPNDKVSVSVAISGDDIDVEVY